MPRGSRNAPGGMVFHVCNRGVGRARIFHKDADYQAFGRILAEAHDRPMLLAPMRILAYCMMPNHWHMVLWPRTDGDLSAWLRWVTITHTQRYHAHYHTSGTGHLYQSRFKSFPVAADPHLLIVNRYVERNALRAGLVARAEDWPWGSLWQRVRGGGAGAPLLSEWPIEIPGDWVGFVNEPQTDAELGEVRHALKRGCPFGDDAWRARVAGELALEATLRPQGRPRKAGAAGTETV